MNVAGGKDNLDRWKPKQYRHYLTLGEVAELVKRDRSRIRHAEMSGKIPAPIRVKVGRLSVRLYSPEEVAIIVSVFKKTNPKGGRPKRDKRRKRTYD